MKYKVLYKDVILFTTNSKQEAINEITAHAAKRGLSFDSDYKIFGRIILLFYNLNNYYSYTIIKE